MKERLASFFGDLRHAGLHLRRSPGFTVFAVLVLGLGIGAVTLVYSATRGILLRPLPFGVPEQLVGVQAVNAGKGIVQPAISAGDFRDLAQRQTVFSSFGACRPDFATWKPEGRAPVQLVAALVTEDFLATLQVHAFRGRVFSREDYTGASVVVLSYQVWQGRFASDPEIVGRTIVLNEQLHTVIGIMPAEAREPAFVDLWLPFPPESPEYFARDSHYWVAVGRLAPGRSAAAADAQLRGIADDLAREHVATNRGWSVRVDGLHELRVGHLRGSLQLLLAATACLLVVTCCNLASLLLARGLKRLDEVAVRLALGASRARICTQILCEHALIGLAGGALGAGLAHAGVRLLVNRLPSELIPRVNEVSVDAGVLALTATLSLAAGLAAGALPAWQAGRTSLTAALGEGSARTGVGAGTRRWQRTLVAIQVAVTCVVLAAGGTLARSFWRLQQTDFGFRAEGVFLLRATPPITRFENNGDMARYFDRLVETAAGVIGVESAAVDCSAPLGGITLHFPYQVVGDSVDQTGASEAVFNAVSPGLREVLGLRLVSGRWLDAHDHETGAPVVVINEALARRLASTGPVLGRQISLVPWLSPRPHEVVGVVGDVRQENLADVPPPQVYVPQRQAPWFFSTLLVRVAGERPLPAAALRDALQRVDPGLAVEFRAHRETVDATLLQPRLLGGLFMGLGAGALLATLFGVYAVLRFAVAQRLREFGVRLALGATPAGITRLVVRETAVVVAFGLLLGVPAAMALHQALRHQIPMTLAEAPLALGVGALLLALASLGAALGPAWQAARLAPAAALRRM